MSKEVNDVFKNILLAIHPVRVYSLQAAMSWFLENRDANGVLCVHAGGETKLCKTYPDAVDFFTS